MYIINKNINNIIMDNDQIKKLEKSFDKYKNKIVNMIEKECNDIQPYINSYTDVYTGWELKNNNNQKELNKDNKVKK